MSMTMQSVESSQILRVGFDPERGAARVEFRRPRTEDVSAIWEYGDEEHPVTQLDFDLWMKSDSIGRFFGQHIKNVYPSRCIEKR